MNRDFLDVLQELLDAKSRFLVVGAFALSVHAEPRATGDIDIWVEPNLENSERTYAALVSFGAPLQDLTTNDLATEEIVFQMGLPPNLIDILTSISGVTFHEAWASHIEVELFGLEVPVIGKEMLLKNKLAAGRPKDLADVESIKKYKN